MKTRPGLAASAIALMMAPGAPALAQTTPAPQEFSLPSPLGGAISGQADRATAPASTAVILVAGTGAFDRDAWFGRSGTARDLIFRDLAERFAARGLIAVRYDRRGVIRPAAPGPARIDPALAASITTQSQRDDLAAVYAWTRSREGANAKCVIFFGHSEGTAHIGRLAETSAPAPLAVIGMGALMAGPAASIRWQAVGRDLHSIELLDADHDGVTTTEEIRARFDAAPSSVFGRIEPFILPDGGWDAADKRLLTANQTAIYETMKADALGHADTDLYPNAQQPQASYQWWKSWFSDDAPIARSLARWPSPVILHYGARDSQLLPEDQIAAAREALLAARLTAVIHPDVGHSLGEHVLLGPVDASIADRIADEAAAAARDCR
jgi:dienelactone hydrolase